MKKLNYLVKFGITDKEIQVGWHYPEICAILAGVLILLLYVNSEDAVAKVLSLRFFREIGAASYCVFLVQSVFVRIIHVASGEKLWIIVCISSSGIGYMSYHLFETPLSQAVSRWLKNTFSQARRDNYEKNRICSIGLCYGSHVRIRTMSDECGSGVQTHNAEGGSNL